MRSRFVMFPLPFFSLHFLVEFTTMFYFCFCRFGSYFVFFGLLLSHFFIGLAGCVWSYPENCNVVYRFVLFYCTLTYFTSLYLTLLHFTPFHFTSLHFTSLHFTSLYFAFILPCFCVVSYLLCVCVCVLFTCFNLFL